MAERQEGEGRRAGAAAGATAPSYQIAIRLARSGAPREELMTSCGLTHQEAELVQRLHAPRRKPKLVAATLNETRVTLCSGALSSTAATGPIPNGQH